MAKLILSLDGSVIREVPLDKDKLKYVADAPAAGQPPADDFEKTMVLRSPAAAKTATAHKALGDMQGGIAPAAAAPAAAAAKPAEAWPLAAIQILNGPNAGMERELTKNLTTLGKPGVQVAVITRRPQGYFITHVEGASFPVVNGKTLDAQAHPLRDHDVIELTGVKMEFFVKSK